MLMELSQGPSQLFMKVSLRDLGLVGMDGEFNRNLQRDASGMLSTQRAVGAVGARGVSF